MRCASYVAGIQLILCSFIHSAWYLGGGVWEDFRGDFGGWVRFLGA